MRNLRPPFTGRPFLPPSPPPGGEGPGERGGSPSAEPLTAEAFGGPSFQRGLPPLSPGPSPPGGGEGGKTRRRLAAAALTAALAGCAPSAELWRHILLPESRSIAPRDPADLPPVRVPATAVPRTVTAPQPDTPEWRLSLDDTIRIALENARVIRVLAGTSAAASGATVYDAAITNTTIDQEQATFDPQLSQRNTFNRIESPFATPVPFAPGVAIDATRADQYRNDFALTKTNVLGGQWSVGWVNDLQRYGTQGRNVGFLLNPQNRSQAELGYTQPLLRGAGFAVNTAPIVIARLNTERSFFQTKDATQTLVTGAAEGYWNLVFARTQLWARKIQVSQSKEAYDRAKARKEAGLADIRDVAQAGVSYNQFRAQQIAAEAEVLDREAALRNLLGLAPNDARVLVPTSPPTAKRLPVEWDKLVALASERRPDVVELKLVLEADQVRLLQANNTALPTLNTQALYRWNGLSGHVVPTGERVESEAGRYTDWTLGVNFAVPLGLRQARALVRQSELVIARDRANLDQSVHAAVHELAGTVRTLDSVFEQYTAFGATRAAAEVNLRVQIAEYDVGRAIYLNVLQAITDFGNAVVSEAQALTTYNIALAQLERQTGTVLETHGLVFQEERFRAAGPLGVCGHDALYPAATRPVGEPARYPPRDDPAENAFDLRNPDPRQKALPAAPPPPATPP